MSFNKLIIHGRRLNIKWGRSQAQQSTGRKDGEMDRKLEPVPGLPGGKDLIQFHSLKIILQYMYGIHMFCVPVPGRQICKG